MKILIALVLTLLCGCGGYRPGDRYEVVVDSSADAVFTDDVIMATDMWASRVPVHFEVIVADRCDATDGRICVHSVSHAELMQKDPTATSSTWATTKQPVGSFGRQDGANVYIAETVITPERLHFTIAHELGHAMGLGHTGRGTLMCAFDNCMADNVTGADARQWYDIRR